jgi:hypothetical protein
MPQHMQMKKESKPMYKLQFVMLIMWILENKYSCKPSFKYYLFKLRCIFYQGRATTANIVL